MDEDTKRWLDHLAFGKIAELARRMYDFYGRPKVLPAGSFRQELSWYFLWKNAK